MLTFRRKLGQKIVIDGRIVVTVRAVKEGEVSVSVDAPRDVDVDRGEIHELRARRGEAKPLPESHRFGLRP